LERFTTAFPGAVLDKNTGLVWEQSPSTIMPGMLLGTTTWTAARTQCVEKNVGGTRGWRLPSVVELASLIDPSLGKPFLPVGVFKDVQLFPYWSATANADLLPGSTGKLTVSFDDGTVSSTAKSFPSHFWCVRGPMQASAY
jgi:hypothetical protein